MSGFGCLNQDFEQKSEGIYFEFLSLDKSPNYGHLIKALREKVLILE